MTAESFFGSTCGLGTGDRGEDRDGWNLSLETWRELDASVGDGRV